MTVDGLTRTFPVAVDGESVWLLADGATVHATERDTVHAGAADAAASPQLVSPLPGTVVLVPAVDGAHVEVGDAVAVVEAMKMEHVLRAAVAGTVRIAVAVGDRVARGGVVATVEPD